MHDSKRNVIQTDSCPSGEARRRRSADSRWVVGRMDASCDRLSRTLCDSVCWKLIKCGEAQADCHMTGHVTLVSVVTPSCV